MPRNPKEITKQSSRRGNNEGSIFQRKDGRWCGQVTTGYVDGKQIKKSIYGKSRQEVAKLLSESVHTVFYQGYVSTVCNKDTSFIEAFVDWFNTFKVPSISDSTIEKNINFIKNHIKSYFKDAKLIKLDTIVFQKYFNHLGKNGPCLQSIKHIKQLINQFYLYAVKKKLVLENPIEDVKVKVENRAEKDESKMALSGELREKVLVAAFKDEILRPIIVTFILTGLRPGELIALKWENIDFKQKKISIQQSTTYEIEFDENGKAIQKNIAIGKTKTVLSARTFEAPDIVMNVLQKWFERQAEQENKTGLDMTKPNNFVFCTKSGTMRTYSGLRSLLRRFIQKNGWTDKDVHLYTFRHTFATMLLEARENPKIVSELMGHANVTTLLRVYSHVTESVYKHTANTLDVGFRGIFANAEVPAF